MDDEPQLPSQSQRSSAPGVLATLLSVAAAFFGVQSEARRKRDFERGRPIVFIILGLFMTLGFIGMVWLAVHFALQNAGM